MTPPRFAALRNPTSRLGRILGLGLTAALALGPGAHAARTIWVDALNETGTEDGTQQYPYRSIRTAIQVAVPFDSVTVAPGTYREFLVMKSAVDVDCQVPPTCVIDATGFATSAVTFDRTTEGPRLEGFTITGGSGFEFGSIGGGVPIFFGGGIRIAGASPLVRNNVIEGNVVAEGAARGGGIAISGQGQTPQIIGNVIRNNVAYSPGHEPDSLGGGIWVSTRSSEIVITDNVIEGNRAYQGGGIWTTNVSDATIHLLRNIVQDNEARQGAGIFTRDTLDGSTTIANNVVIGNGTLEGTVDCNDASGTTAPGLPELCGDGVDNDCNPATPDVFDADADGYDCGPDCNDANAAVRPGAVELCNDGVDNDCDALTDALDTAACGCADADADGSACGDCDDTRATVHPGLAEVCNDGLDNDCDAATLDVFDADADGANCAADCLDTDPTVHPGAAEVHCNVLDDDCSPLTPDVVDFDSDLWDCTVDCNDATVAVNPDVLEFCFDGFDNNCNGLVDAQDPECICADPVDFDGDGSRCLDCDDSNPLVHPALNEICDDGLNNDCSPSTPDVFDTDADGFDCDVDCEDLDPAVRPSAAERCNDGIDNDCDALIDALDTGDCGCADADFDGYACDDCNDASSPVNPGRAEICNDGIDNDCNPATLDLLDADGDGYTCVTDCDDLRADVRPNAAEQCADMRDNDCDGLIDLPYPEIELVAFGSPLRYLANQSNPGIPMIWVARGYNDTTWLNGSYGIGYELGGGGVNGLAVTDVPVGTVSIYTRARFDIVDPAGVNQLLLGADWDDAYVAWINGLEVYRSPEVPAGSLSWNTPVAGHESSNGQVPSYGTPINVSAAGIPALVSGENVLAVGVWNSGGATSSDLIIVPRLWISYGDSDPDCACADADSDHYRCDDCNDANPAIYPGRAEIGCNGLNDDCSASTNDVLDFDGDGSACNADCNDKAASVYPGAPELPCNGADDDCSASTLDSFDVDGDTYSCAIDCDETNTAINPAAAEIACDGIDNDCNGLTSDRIDADKDGYLCHLECNDANAAINPGRAEKCNNGLDDDCDGLTDALDTADCACADADGDGYNCTDCNDASSAIRPDRSEVCNDGIDNDCDAETLDVDDADGDLVDCLTDCDDSNPFVRPTAAEACNDGLNNDCNGATPDVFDADGDGSDCTVDCRDDVATIEPGQPELCNDGVDNDCNVLSIDLFDADLDGSNCAFDCNDANGFVFPGAFEVCNDGIDNDCDPATLDLFDADGDGSNCVADCNDANPAISPTAAEQCTDGIDNDCDAKIDNITPRDPDCQNCNDVDADGYNCDDCNDANPNVHPGVAEVCNDGIDNDCSPATPDLFDADGDGYACSVDCNDANPLVHPGAPEICNDGVADNDCNPQTPGVVDADGDGSTCDFDCDDANPSVRPGVPEVSCNGVNDDCNTATLDVRDGDSDGVGCADTSVRGGGLNARSGGLGQVSILNNTLVGNSMPRGTGGGAYVDDMSSVVAARGVVANNVVSANTAVRGGGIDHTLFFGEIAANDLFQNAGGDLYNAGGSTAALDGNAFVDPSFASAATGNYRLRAGSPMIDAAQATLAPLTDADAVPRPFDGDADSLAVADVGAYEYPSAEVPGMVFVNKTTLSWTVGVGDVYYNVYRGSMNHLRATGRYTQDPAVVANAAQFCHVPPAGVPLVDPFSPTAVDMVFYLVTQTDFRKTYEGTLGQRSSGMLRFNDFPCP